MESADENKLNEPSASYKLSNSFKTFKVASFEEMEEERRLYSAKLTPIERLHYLQELNKIAFGEIENSFSKLWTKVIHIKK